MNLDAKTLSEHIYFAENLKAAVSELAVTQAELARAIGKDQKTVGRYISGETYPEGSIAEIAEYLLSRLVDENDHVHITSEEFEEIFSDIYNFLQDNGIREAEFAKMLGVSQKTLNNYHNHRFNKGEALTLSTEMQHKIIDAFENLGGRLFPFDSEDDTPSQAKSRSRFYNLHWKLANYNREFAKSVSEMWRLLIRSYTSGKANFFVYSPEKLELVCFYLRFLISEFNGLLSMTYNELSETRKCGDYYFREDVASLDFLYEPHDEYEGEDFGTWKSGDDQTPNYWCSLLCSEIGGFWGAFNALSLREKNEINELLREVFDAKTRWLDENREYYKTINVSPFHFRIYNERSKKEKISGEEIMALSEMFSKLPAAYQETIIECFDLFFWGISFENLDEVLAAHKRLAVIPNNDKLKIIKRFEAELMGELWKTNSKYDEDFFDKYDDFPLGIWGDCAQYMELMSFVTVKYCNYLKPPSEEYTKKFERLCRSLAKDIDPVPLMKAQIEYSPADWYANMLADIALLKGMRLDEMLSAIEDQ